MFRKRFTTLHDYRAGRFFRRLEVFLGSEEIDRRIEKVKKEIQIESGAYLKYWVYPRLSWWLGFDEARNIIKRNGSFRRSLTKIMEYPLQTAMKIDALYSSMSENKRNEYRSRILSDDILEPTLFEIDCAAHFFQLGYEIDWFESKSDEQIRTPEFVAKQNGIELEVECKTKKADAGRRIERKYFYRIVDSLIPIIDEKKLSGILTMTIPSRVPSKSSWHKEAKQTVRERINFGEGAIELPEAITLQFSLRNTNGKKVKINELGEFHDYNEHPYAHYALKGEFENGFIVDPIALKMTSKKTDSFLDNVLDSLRNAECQFTKTRSSIISCMLPEVDNFYGFQDNSAIQKTTYYFFEKYAGEYINAVSYASDPLREVNGLVISSDRPSLSFRNHNYNKEFGPEKIPLY